MKITITRLLDTSRYLASKVGQEIPDFFAYMAEFVEQAVRALRNGLTFTDNFDCQVKTVSLKHATAQTIQADKAVTGLIPIRVVSQNYGITSHTWYYDTSGNLKLTVNFNGSPTDTINVVIVLLF